MTRRLLATFVLAASSLFALSTTAQEEAPEGATADAAAALGERLFAEQLFTNPSADYEASCAGCHIPDGDLSDRNSRLFADYVPRSLRAGKETTLRNTPTLMDAWRAELYGWSGAWGDLEQLVLDKMIGETMGWKPEDRQRALEAIHFTLLHEGTGGGPGKSYLEHFQDAYGVDLEQVSVEEAVRYGARAIADYTRTLSSTHTSRWDAFAEQNRFMKGPIEGETADAYAWNLESRIGNQEGRNLIRRPEGFSRDAYEGFKVFMRVWGEEDQAVGNCVACHVPPHFTDFAFHNVGVTQDEYDRTHEPGAFLDYEPPAEPSDATQAVPDSSDAARVDLGRFNQVRGEARDAALAAFKTPTLRNISHTDPYFHNGLHATLEEAIAAKIRWSQLAKEGKLRNASPELLEMRLSERDVAPLAAFLRMLDDVGPENFRYYLINFEND